MTDHPTYSSYPVVLNQLNTLNCVLIGGGTIAERKLRDLLHANANPTIISPTLTPRAEGWRNKHQLTHHARPYKTGDLKDAFLVIAASNNPDVNNAAAQEAHARGILINVVTNATNGNFYTTATIRRDDLLLSVSTSGQSPLLSRNIKQELEQHFGNDYAILSRIFKTFREDLKRLSPEARDCFYRTLSDKTQRQRLQNAPQEVNNAYVRSLITHLQTRTEQHIPQGVS